jgi:hypothetical protein
MATNDISSEDWELEEMLRQAALLEAQLTSSSSVGDRSLYDESVQASGSTILDEGLSLAYSEDPGTEEENTDDMLLQAHVLATKMRAPSSVTPEVVDQSDASIDDMLHKAELLALKIKSAETTPLSSPGRTSKTPVENTPALIRHSERLLSNMHRDHNKDSGTITTPELMYQTEHLVERMKSSSHTGASNLIAHLNPPKEGAFRGDVSLTDDVLSTSDVLLEKVTPRSSSDRQAASHASTVVTPSSMPSSDQDKARSEELRRLMEEALSTWTNSGEDANRVKDALDQIIPKLGSTSISVSLSTQQAETDEMSSIGSASPLTPPKELLNTESLTHRPRLPLLPPSHKANAAVEMARNMATALEETRSEASFDAGHDTSVMNTPTVMPTLNGRSLEAREQVTYEARPVTAAQDVRSTGFNGVTKDHVQTRPRHVSSEEAQYNAIMSAINSAPKAGVSWEKVTSASTEDDDYVALVDYSKNAGVQKKSAGITSIVTRNQFSRLPRQRKSKLVRRIFAVVFLLAIALLARVWLNSDTDEATTSEMNLPRETARFEDTYIGGIDKPIMEAKEVTPIVEGKEDTPVVEEKEDTPIMEEKDYTPITEEQEDLPSIEPVNTRALQKCDANVRSFSKIRMKVLQTVRHVRKFIMLFVVRLTPPWERFCGPDEAAACRKTAFSMSSIGTH